jgi:hypothetical protein
VTDISPAGDAPLVRRIMAAAVAGRALEEPGRGRDRS